MESVVGQKSPNAARKRARTRGAILVCVCLLWALAAFPIRADDEPDVILVIANKAVAVREISRDELRHIFQTKTSTWPDGSTVRPFNLPEADPARRGFDAAALGLDPERVSRYWIDRKIRGGSRPPQTAPSGALMVRIVAKTSGAIGYVDQSVALNGQVKVIAKVVGGRVLGP